MHVVVAQGPESRMHAACAASGRTPGRFLVAAICDGQLVDTYGRKVRHVWYRDERTLLNILWWFSDGRFCAKHRSGNLGNIWPYVDRTPDAKNCVRRHVD
jgi:hypothetical protein